MHDIGVEHHGPAIAAGGTRADRPRVVNRRLRRASDLGRGNRDRLCHGPCHGAGDRLVCRRARGGGGQIDPPAGRDGAIGAHHALIVDRQSIVIAAGRLNFLHDLLDRGLLARRIGPHQNAASSRRTNHDIGSAGQTNHAARRVDGAGIGDRPGDNIDRTALRRGNRALIDNRRRGIAGEIQISGEIIGVGDVAGGENQTGGVDCARGTDNDARGIDENQLTVGRERTVDGAGIVGDDAVQGGAAGRHDELGRLTRADREPLPVDDRMQRALIDEQLGQRRIHKAGGASRDHAPGRIGHRRRKGESERAGGRKEFQRAVAEGRHAD